eukprot:14334365-Alexandrium_andersonii.AAC.1
MCIRDSVCTERAGTRSRAGTQCAYECCDAGAGAHLAQAARALALEHLCAQWASAGHVSRCARARGAHAGAAAHD